MATTYITYPQNSGGAGSTGSVTGVPYIVGPLDGAVANNFGGTIGSFTFYQQSATASLPGVVSSAAQTFAGAKSFTGFVAAGNTSPKYNLHVGGLTGALTCFDGAGVAQSPTMAAQTSSGYSMIMVAVSGAGNNRRASFFMDEPNLLWGMSQSNSSGVPLPFVIRTSTGEQFRIGSTGFVGIKTSTPVSNLDVNGSMTVRGSVFITGSVSFVNYQQLPLRVGAAGVLINGSISLSTEVSGILPSSMVLGSVTGSPYLVGPFNSAASNVNGATIGSSSLYMQGATATAPGLVSSASQTFAGSKTFTSPVLVPNGSVTVPSVAFSVETNTGIYYIGTSSFALAVSGVQAMNLSTSSAGAFGNVGMGGAASTSPLFPLVVQRTQDGGFLTQALSNISSVAGSGGRLQALVDNGVNSAEVIATSVNTAAPDVYAGGRAVFRSAGNMTGINFLNGATDGTTKFYVGGNGTVGEVSATVGSGGLYAKTMLAAPIHRVGSVSMTSSTSGASYPVAWPGAQGGANTVPVNDGAGNISWQSALSNPMTTGGDIIVSSGSGVATRLALTGSTGMSLTIDRSVGLEVKWGVPLSQIAFTPTSANPPIGSDEQVTLNYGTGANDLTANLPNPLLNGGKRIVISNVNITSSTGSYAAVVVGSATMVVDGKVITGGGSYVFTTKGETLELLAVSSTNSWVSLNRNTNTAWTSFVPTNTQGLGSLTAVSFVWRRDGPDMLIRGAAISGTVTASEAQFGIPEGLITESAVLSSGSFLVGAFAIAGNGVQYPTVIAEGARAFLNFGSQNSGTASLVKQNGSTVVGNTTRFSLDVRIPINGWGV